MKTVIRTTTMLSIAALLGIPFQMAHAGDAKADASAATEPTDDEALEDDILAVLDLPLVTHAAVEAGVAEAEVSIVLTASIDVGFSAGEATAVLASGTEVAESKEPTENFGQWVRAQVASGVRGQELAAKIAAKKAKFKAAKAKDDEKIHAKLASLKAQRKAWRAKARERRKELKKSGKELKFLGKERHEELSKELAAAREELLQRRKALVAEKGGVHKPMPGQPQPAPGMKTAKHERPEPPGQQKNPDVPSAHHPDAKLEKEQAKGKDAKGERKADEGKKDKPPAKPSPAGVGAGAKLGKGQADPQGKAEGQN